MFKCFKKRVLPRNYIPQQNSSNFEVRFLYVTWVIFRLLSVAWCKLRKASLTLVLCLCLNFGTDSILSFCICRHFDSWHCTTVQCTRYSVTKARFILLIVQTAPHLNTRLQIYEITISESRRPWTEFISLVYVHTSEAYKLARKSAKSIQPPQTPLSYTFLTAPTSNDVRKSCSNLNQC